MALKQELDDVEMEVMKNIKHSKNLNDFLRIVEDLAEEFDDEIADAVEEEKHLLDDKINHSKLSYLVLRRKSYNEIN